MGSISNFPATKTFVDFPTAIISSEQNCKVSPIANDDNQSSASSSSDDANKKRKRRLFNFGKKSDKSKTKSS
jgi:hypothetical protein